MLTSILIPTIFSSGTVMADTGSQVSDSSAKTVLKRLNQKNNLYNSSFPSSTRQSILNESLKAETSSQLIFTFATLKGSSYYKNAFDGDGDKVTKIWNNLGTGVNLNFDVGSKNISSKFGSDDTSNDATVAEKTETSSPGSNKDANTSNEESIANNSAVKKVAKEIADSTYQASVGNTSHKAIAVDGRAFNSGTTSGSPVISKSGILGINFTGGWRNDGTKAQTNMYAAQLGDGEKSSQATGDLNKTSTMSTSINSNASAPSGYTQSIQSAIAKYILANTDKFNSTSKVKNALSGLSFSQLYSSTSEISTDINKGGGFLTTAKSAKINHIRSSVTYIGSSYVGLGMTLGTGNKDEVNYDSDATSAMAKINPASVIGQSVSDNKYLTAVKNRVEKANNVSISDSDAEAIKNAVGNISDSASQQSGTASGLRLLGWVPLFPTTSTEKTNEEKGKDYYVDGHFFKDATGVNFSGVAWLSKTLISNSKIFNGSLFGIGSIDSGLAFNSKSYSENAAPISTTADWYQEWFGNKGFLSAGSISASGNEVIGMDTIGNIIDGETSSVVVPYWQSAEETGLGARSYVPFSGETLNKNAQKGGKDTLTSTTNAQIKSVTGSTSNKLYKWAVALRDKLNSQKGASPSKIISDANSVTGDSSVSGNTYSDSGAAAMATLLTAKYDASKLTSEVLSGGKGITQLYVGASDADKKTTANKSNNNSNLFTAEDIIQYIGLRVFNGSFDDLRKTFASAIANDYNTNIVENKNGAFYTTNDFIGADLLFNSGATPYLIISMIVVAIFIIAAIRYTFYTEKLTQGIKRLIQLALILTFAMFMPVLKSFFLDTPTKYISQKPIMQQALVDQWSRLRQQESLNNVFYSSLFGDKSGGVNKSTDYMLKFYTATTSNGSINTDELVNSDPKKTYSAFKIRANSLLGIGKNGTSSVTLGSSNKSVKVSMMDLLSWASHMTRQKYSAEGKTGYDYTSNLYEEPNTVVTDDTTSGKSTTDSNGNDTTTSTSNSNDSSNKNDPYADRKNGDTWKPGEQPLFDWLAHNYSPIGDNYQQQHSSDGSDSSDGSSSSKKSSKSTGSGAKGKDPSNHPKSGASNWIPFIKKAAKAMKVSITSAQVQKIVAVIDNESSGNEKVVANYAGSPTGLLQYKQSTFDHYAVKGHTDIKNGWDQLLALFNDSNWEKDMTTGGWGPTGSKRKSQAGATATGGTISLTGDVRSSTIMDESVSDPNAQKGADSSSNDSDSNSSDSSSSSSTGNGKTFGKDRNPADTSQKSAYTGTAGSSNSGAASSKTIDNSSLYKYFDQYYEYAANTNNYANNDSDGKSNNDGSMLTASDAFLKMWQTVFETANNGSEKGSMDNFIALTNIANVINGYTKNQTNDTTTGADNNITGNVSTNFTPGLAGKNALIDEMSMPSAMRNGENGTANAGYSYAARQMIAKFNIAAPTSDYFDLSGNNDLYNTYVPKSEQNTSSKNTQIYRINKQTLNDYIQNLSTVRASIDPDESTDDSSTTNAVDPYTMAESQIVAIQLWFNMNRDLGYGTAFPTGFEANGFSMDALNRILYVPIAEIGKEVDDTSQYNDKDVNTESPVRLQDNVSEFFVLRGSIIDDIGFTLAQWAERIYSWIITFAIKWLYLAVLFLSILMFWKARKPNADGNHDLKMLFNGTLSFLIVFGIIKFIHNWIIVVLAERMNNSYVMNSYYKTPLGTHAWIQFIMDAIIIYWLFKRYLPFIKNNWRTLGGQDTLGQTLQQTASGSKTSKPSKDLIRNALRKTKNLGIAGAIGTSHLMKKIAYKASAHRKQVQMAKSNGTYESAKMRLTKFLQKLRHMGKEIPSGYYDNDTAQKLHDIEAARVDGIRPSRAGGLQDGQKSLTAKTGFLKVPMSKGAASALGHTRDDDGMISIPINEVQAMTKSGRKEVLQTMRSNLGDKMRALHDMPSASYATFNGTPITTNSDGSLNIPIGKNGLSSEHWRRLLRNKEFANDFQVVQAPISLVNGNYANGNARIMPSASLNKVNFQNWMNHSGAKQENILTVTNAILNPSQMDQARKMGIRFGLDGSMLLQRGNAQQLDFAKNIMNQSNETMKNRMQNFNQGMSALNNSILNSTPDSFSPDGGMETNFRSDNTKVSQQVKALKGLANKPGFSIRGLRAQDALNRAMVTSAGSPQKLAQDLRENIENDRSIPESKRIKASSAFDEFLKNNPEDIAYDQQSRIVRSQTMQAFKNLNNTLDEMKVLNKAQNKTAEKLGLSNSDEMKAINDIREQINSSGRHARRFFQDSTVGAIARNASYTANAGISHDKTNNVIKIKRKEENDFNKSADKGLQNFLNN